MTTNVSPTDIQAFVTANIGNPQAIATAAKQYGVTSDQIASALGVSLDTVNNYFADAGIAAPPVSTPVNTSTSTPVSPASANLSVYNAQTQQGIQNAGLQDVMNAVTQGSNISQLSQYNPQAVTQPYKNASGIYVTPSANTYSISAPDGSGGSLNYFFTVDPNTGTTTPISDPGTNLTYTPGSPGRVIGGAVGNILGSIQNINLATLGEAALAYYIPVAGEALAEALSTASVTIPSYVGTALAATAANVAQGQDVITAAKNALPGLISSGVISQVQANNLLTQISTDQATQQYITTAATSALKTVAAGGNGTDILNNIASSVVGTAAGDALNNQTLGQGIASTLATQSLGAGIVGAAGSAGSQQAAANAAATTTPTTLSSINATDALNQLNTLNQQLFQSGLTAFAGPGLPPEATQAASVLTNQILDLIKTNAFDSTVSAQDLQTLVQTASKYIDPTVFAKSLIPIALLLTPSTAGDPKEDQLVAAKYQVLQNQTGTTLPLTPLQTGTLTPNVVTPVTADVSNVATALNISTDEALLLQQTNPNLFANLSGSTGQPVFVPADPETMRSTDLVVNPTGGANDNIILQKGTTSTAQTTEPSNQLVITTDPSTQTALVVTPNGEITVVSTANQLVQPGETVIIDPTTNTIISTQTTQKIASQLVTQPATQGTTQSTNTTQDTTQPTNTTQTQTQTQIQTQKQTPTPPIFTPTPTLKPPAPTPTPTFTPTPNPPTPTPTPTPTPNPPKPSPTPTPTPTPTFTPEPPTPTPTQTQTQLQTGTQTPTPTIITDYVKKKIVPPLPGLITSGPTALTGVTQGLGGGGGGVNVESGLEQQPVWNISSLKLRPGEEGEDYSNLSSALGI